MRALLAWSSTTVVATAEVMSEGECMSSHTAAESGPLTSGGRADLGGPRPYGLTRDALVQ